MAFIAWTRSTPIRLDAGRLSWLASASLASVTRPRESTMAAAIRLHMPAFDEELGRGRHGAAGPVRHEPVTHKANSFNDRNPCSSRCLTGLPQALGDGLCGVGIHRSQLAKTLQGQPPEPFRMALPPGHGCVIASQRRQQRQVHAGRVVACGMPASCRPHRACRRRCAARIAACGSSAAGAGPAAGGALLDGRGWRRFCRARQRGEGHLRREGRWWRALAPIAALARRWPRAWRPVWARCGLTGAAGGVGTGGAAAVEAAPAVRTGCAVWPAAAAFIRLHRGWHDGRRRGGLDGRRHGWGGAGGASGAMSPERQSRSAARARCGIVGIGLAEGGVLACSPLGQDAALVGSRMQGADDEDDPAGHAKHPAQQDQRQAVGAGRKDVGSVSSLGPDEIAAAAGQSGPHEELQNAQQHQRHPSLAV